MRSLRRRLNLELLLIRVFGLRQPPADTPLRDRRRDTELEWREQALWRLRWQIPLTWVLHWMLRTMTIGLWGRARPN